jgi:hypothetical protein
MYEDSNLKTDCQISEDWKSRLSCNHYIKFFYFNQNVANKNTNKKDSFKWDERDEEAFNLLKKTNVYPSCPRPIRFF